VSRRAESGARTSRCPRQCRLRLDVELPGEVGGGKKDVAHLVFQGAALGGFSEFGLELGDFFFELVEHRSRIGRVKADPRRAFLDLFGSQLGGQIQCESVEDAFHYSTRLGAVPTLGSLVFLPDLVLPRYRIDLDDTEVCPPKEMSRIPGRTSEPCVEQRPTGDRL
jgi:hypothetical protein